jgi:CRISPR system Cascade subunit CasA
MGEFNLIDEPWIPCIALDDRNVEHGVRDALLKAHTLREICDDSPLVTVAIHRMLLAILSRMYEGPKSFASWRSLYSGGAFDTQTVNQYLEKWKDWFDLFGEDRPFYQMAGLQTNKPISVNRLASECASGNNATLFDHCTDDVEVRWSPAQAARRLIACQAFASGGGKCSKARIASTEETRPNFADAPALRGMNIWLQGTTLFETLMMNLVPADDDSLPPWEVDEPHKYRDRTGAWQSRLVRFVHRCGAISGMYYTQGRSADKSSGDPMKVYRTSREEGVSALPLSSGKAAWREAHSILMIGDAKSNECRPECLNIVARARSSGIVSPGSSFIMQIVGLASERNKAAKFILWRHERMPIPVDLTSDVNAIERLGLLLENAEQVANGANGLKERARRVGKLYLSPDCESPGGRQPDKDEVTKVVKTIDPRPAYWARLEEHFFRLLEDLPKDWDEQRGDWRPDDQQIATRAWRNSIKREAGRALQGSIRSLGTTGRAIQAVARVRTDFGDEDLRLPQPKDTGVTKGKPKGGKKK